MVTAKKKRFSIVKESLPIQPSGFSVARGEHDVMMTFIWISPDEPDKAHVVSRVILNEQQIKDISESLTSELKKIEKNKKKDNKK